MRRTAAPHRLVPVLLALAGLLALGPTARAADFPTRPVKLLTQGAPGSGPDVIARVLAEHLGRRWGQPVQVVTQTGAAGLVVGRIAAAAEPDGYTLFLPSITAFVILPEMHDALPFDLDRDFVRLGFVAELPMAIAVDARLSPRSLGELVELARAKPDALFYAASSRGSLPHLVGSMFATKGGAPLTFVAYQGAAAGLQDVMGGRVGVIVDSLGALDGAIRSGAVRPLAVTSPHRLATHPELPAAAETIPGFAAMGWIVLMAPAGVPPDIVRTVNRDLNATLAQPDLVQRLHDLGAFPRALSPDDTTAYIHREQDAWRPVVRALNLRAQ